MVSQQGPEKGVRFPVMRRVFAIVAMVCVGVLGIAPTAARAKDQNNLDGAEKAFLRYTGHINDREWGSMYGFIHPAQRAAFGKATFTACLDKAIPRGSRIKDITFTDHFKETVTVPGTDVKAKSTALTVEYTAILADKREKPIQDIVHTFYNGGRWRFALTADRFADCTNTIST
jgi:hypothetical protein